MEELRRNLAAASRMLVDAGILGYSGHLSTRVGDGGRLLIQPVDDVRAELRPDRLLVVTLEGDLADGDGRPPSELAIHTEIYRARPDVGAVAHFHHDPTTVFTVAGDHPIVPVKNHASRWSSGVPVHPDPSHIASAEQGRALNATLLASALALGQVKPLSETECDRFAATFSRGRHARKLWTYYTTVAATAGRLPAGWWGEQAA